MARYFFKKGAECCYSIQYHLDYMKENNLTEMDVYEAKIDIGNKYFFCKEFQEIGEVGKSCGKSCSCYRPMNGKSGRCKSYGWPYEETDKKTTLKINL